MTDPVSAPSGKHLSCYWHKARGEDWCDCPMVEPKTAPSDRCPTCNGPVNVIWPKVGDPVYEHQPVPAPSVAETLRELAKCCAEDPDMACRLSDEEKAACEAGARALEENERLRKRLEPAPHSLGAVWKAAAEASEQREAQARAALLADVRKLVAEVPMEARDGEARFIDRAAVFAALATLDAAPPQETKK